MNSRAIRVSIAGLLLYVSPMLAQSNVPATPNRNAPQSAPKPNSGSVRGTVTDNSGGILPGAEVTLTDSAGETKTVSAQADGTYVFTNVPEGSYTVSSVFKGLTQSGVLIVSVTAGKPAIGNVRMDVEAQKQELTVTDSQAAQVSTDPANNASSLVLGKEEMQSLPDDPDDLQADLQALAGPSSGPGGNQIYVDGFTGGNMPPKESIREIRVNQNPFSAEFDKLGFGRVEILTKPGTDKFHGQAFYSVSDSTFDARNPYLNRKPDFRTQLINANLAGPISKKASFFIDAQRRYIDDFAAIVATDISRTTFLPVPVNESLATPQVRTSVSPRVDYQLNTNNTLSMRYSFEGNRQNATLGSAGASGSNGGNYLLPSTAYRSTYAFHQAQITETAILSPQVVNETRFRYRREMENQNPFQTGPQINVQGSVVTGGSTVGNSSFSSDGFEVQNYTSLSLGRHSSKFGVRIRTATTNSYSPQNFNGTYTFSSLDQYARTLLYQSQGLSPSQIRLLGGGATNLTINSGQPYVGIDQTDWGLYYQDDWKIQPNFTLSTGLRYEGQTNVSDHADFAPRVGFAWSPKVGSGNAKTVIRGGFGLFYQRFDSDNVLSAARYNGTNQQVYNVLNPDTFPTIPNLNTLVPGDVGRRYQIQRGLQIPYVMQTAIGVERQLARGITASLNYSYTRGNHQYRSRNINAVIPGTDIRPYGDVGDLLQYETSGILKQHQLSVNINGRIGKRITLFSNYAYNNAMSDTDGIGTFPANQYDLRSEYGRASTGIKNRVFVGGSVTAPFGLRLSPFLVARSGVPFNVTTGLDNFDNGIFTARPAFINSSVIGCQDNVDCFNLNPALGQATIPRNYGVGPASVSLNLRVAKTFGFGGDRAGAKGDDGSGRGGRRGGGAGGLGGGGFGGGGGGRGGGGGMFSDATTGARYNVTVGINARNIFNTTNPSTPIGALSGAYALQSIGISGGFGAENTSSTNRRIDLQVRFQF